MLTCERVLARARQGKYLGKTKTYGVIMKNQKTVKPSKTRAKAVQAKAKTKRTATKAKTIANNGNKGLQTVKEKLDATKAKRAEAKAIADNEAKNKAIKAKLLAEQDVLSGGVKATVARYFDSAKTMGKAGATTTTIMKYASGWNAGKQVKTYDKLKAELLTATDTKLDTLAGNALKTFKAEIKGTQRLFNKGKVQDLLLGKERTKRVYFGQLHQRDIDNGKISAEQVKDEGLVIDKYCFTLVAKSAETTDYKSRLEINEKHTEEHRPALNANQEQKDEYLLDLQQAQEHIQAEIDTFSK